jgi:hypothetical protein
MYEFKQEVILWSSEIYMSASFHVVEDTGTKKKKKKSRSAHWGFYGT